MKLPFLIASHVLIAVAGFALGIYALPILIEPQGPSVADIALLAKAALYEGRLSRTLKGSDVLHWGEGSVFVGTRSIALEGKLAPGPDYKLYLSPEFVETNAEFERLKPQMVRLGDVRVFHNPVLPVPSSVDVTHFNTVVVWCETFHQFISAAKYR